MKYLFLKLFLVISVLYSCKKEKNIHHLPEQIDDILYKIELYSEGKVYDDVCTNKNYFFSSCDYYLNGVGYLRNRCVIYDRIRDVPLYEIRYRSQQGALISTINYKVYHYMYDYEKEKPDYYVIRPKFLKKVKNVLPIERIEPKKIDKI